MTTGLQSARPGVRQPDDGSRKSGSLPWLLLLVAVLVAVATIGAILLLCLGKTVPPELWSLVSGGFAFFLGGAAWSYRTGSNQGQ